MSKYSILWQANLRNGDFIEDIQAEARGYLMKYLDIEAMIADIKGMVMGNAIISQVIADGLIDYLRPVSEQTGADVTPTLSIRELEVLRMVAAGASNREIAGQLYISGSTVKAHVRNIMEKMQVKNRAQAVAMAFRNGVLEQYTLGQLSTDYPPKARCGHY